MWETRDWSLGWEDPLEKAKLPTPVFWPGEFHGLSMGSQRVGQNWWLSLHFTPNLFMTLIKQGIRVHLKTTFKNIKQQQNVSKHCQVTMHSNTFLYFRKYKYAVNKCSPIKFFFVFLSITYFVSLFLKNSQYPWFNNSQDMEATYISISRRMDKKAVVHIHNGVFLLLLSRFSRVWLCATTWMATHQAPLSLDSPGKNTGVGCHFLLQCIKVKSENVGAQSCPTLSDPIDCSLPGSSVHGIFQARVLQWGATAFSTIKKNTFESVLMRWMKLEPIIQSEVSQKEKHQYSILMHIYGI